MSPEQTIALPHSHALLCRWYFNVEQSATVLICCAIAETHNTSNAVGRTDFIKLVLIISPNDTATLVKLVYGQYGRSVFVVHGKRC